MKKLLIPCLLAGLAACQQPAGKPMGDDKGAANMPLCQRFYDELFNAHTLALLDTFVTADVVDHQASPDYPDGLRGIEELRKALGGFFAAYPDIHSKTNFMIASGDTVMVYFTMTGTNSGAMGGMPATNKQVAIDGVDIIVLRDGKCAEHWGYSEEIKMLTQLGMMPAEGAPADTAATAAL